MFYKKIDFIFSFFVLLTVSSILVACGNMSGNHALVVDGGSHKVINAQIYTVRKGDTLYSISFAANKDYREVAAINQMQPPYRIHAGEVIVLSSHAKINIPRPTAHEQAQIALLEPKIFIRTGVGKKPYKTNKPEVCHYKHKHLNNKHYA